MDEHLLNRPAEIASVLSSLERHRSPLSLHFATSGQDHASLVLGVDREKEEFYLDLPSLLAGQKAAESGERFTVRAVDQGVSIFFSGCQVKEVVELADGPVYVAAFPQQLIHNQKRDAFRVRIPLSYEIKADLLAYERKAPLMAQLVDLSHTGCQLLFSYLVAPPFQKREVFEELTLDLQAFEKKVTVAVEARHARYDDKKQRTLCGFRFIHVDGSTQAEIDRFVIFLQREQRRLGL